MTPDEPDEPLDPVSPEDEARLRALLSDARETGPVPPAVAVRLDGVLAELAAERSLADDPVPADDVVPIERTRRHRVAAVLGVAAAVAVLGLGVGTFFENGGDDDAGQAGAGQTFPERGADAAEGELESAEKAPSSRNEAEGDDDGADVGSVDEVVLFTVRSRHLARDLERLQRSVLASDDAGLYATSRTLVPDGFSCRSADFGRGFLVGVQYDDGPAFVAFREPMGSSQVVEVLQCGTGDVLRSTTLPTAD